MVVKMEFQMLIGLLTCHSELGSESKQIKRGDSETS